METHNIFRKSLTRVALLHDFLCRRSFEDQNLTSFNTGAVEVFALDFLSFRFDRLNYSVPEGDALRYV